MLRDHLLGTTSAILFLKRLLQYLGNIGPLSDQLTHDFEKQNQLYIMDILRK